MTPQDELLRFFIAAWAAAVAGRDKTHAERKIGEYFDALWDRRGGLGTSDELPLVKKRRRPRKEKAPARGTFSPARRAVWFDRAGLGTWLGPNGTPSDADHMLEFYDEGEFATALSNFASTKEETTWWDRELAGARWSSIPSRSILLHGIADGIFWFGARTQAEIDSSIAAHPDAFPPKFIAHAQYDIGQLLKVLNGQQRALILGQRVTNLLASRDRRLLICGTANLTPALVILARALGAAVINESSFTLVHGGRRKVPFVTTDEAVADAAVAAVLALGRKPEDRIVTVMPGAVEPDRVRVPIGKTEVLPDTLYDTRRMGMVHSSDAVISIAGAKTRDLINVAWGMGKPVLPLAFTGGASREFWDRYRGGIIKRIGLTTDDVRLIENGDAEAVVAKRCIAIMKRCLS
jgi:hypothetical protein